MLIIRKHEHQINRSKIMLAVCIGIAGGMALTYGLMLSKTTKLEGENRSLSTLVSDQGVRLAEAGRQLHLAQVAQAKELAQEPAPAVPKPAELTPTPLPTPVPVPTSRPTPTQAPVAQAPKALPQASLPQPAVKPTPKPAPPPPQKQPAPPPSHQVATRQLTPAPAAPITPHANVPQHQVVADHAPPPAAPTSSPPVVKSTLDQANVAGLDSSSVTFRSGVKIQIASSFPSGEKLISISPGERKIVTDRRTIVFVPDEN